jgi:hypothetical protein
VRPVTERADLSLLINEGTTLSRATCTIAGSRANSGSAYHEQADTPGKVSSADYVFAGHNASANVDGKAC